MADKLTFSLALAENLPLIIYNNTKKLGHVQIFLKPLTVNNIKQT